MMAERRRGGPAQRPDREFSALHLVSSPDEYRTEYVDLRGEWVRIILSATGGQQEVGEDGREMPKATKGHRPLRGVFFSHWVP